MGFIRLIFLVFLLQFVCVNTHAANHYILDGGSGDGSAWNNAWDDFPATLVRGDTYYMAGGTYGQQVFDDAESGATYIYIKKATASAHGTETGWSAEYGTEVAIIEKNGGTIAENIITFTTGYWDMDGVVGGGPDSWTLGHGLKVSTDNIKATMVSIEDDGTNPVAGNIHIYHTFFDHVNETPIVAGSYHLYAINGDGDLCGGVGCSPGGHELSYNYFFGSPGYVFLMLNPGILLFEYNYVEGSTHDALGPTGVQGGGFSTYGVHDSIFRYNIFKNIEGNGLIMLYDWDNTFAVNNVEIYGNVAFHESGYSGEPIENMFASEGGAESWDNVEIYNNSFVNMEFAAASTFWFRNTDAGGTGNAVENNLFYKNGLNTNSNYATVWTLFDHDYNWFYLNYDAAVGVGEIEDSGLAALETNPQVGISDPFTDWANEDFSLVADTDPGNTTVCTGFNTDMFGTIRTTCSRGALQHRVGENRASARYEVNGAAVRYEANGAKIIGP